MSARLVFWSVERKTVCNFHWPGSDLVVPLLHFNHHCGQELNNFQFYDSRTQLHDSERGSKKSSLALFEAWCQPVLGFSLPVNRMREKNFQKWFSIIRWWCIHPASGWRVFQLILGNNTTHISHPNCLLLKCHFDAFCQRVLCLVHTGVGWELSPSRPCFFI